MLKIKNGVITLTRGDDCLIDLKIYTPDNKEYIPRNGERARFTVRKEPLYNNSTPPLIEKEFIFVDYSNKEEDKKKENRLQIKIDSVDTKFMNYGTYLYDVQFCDIKSNITTICKGKFIITYEVG